MKKIKKIKKKQFIEFQVGADILGFPVVVRHFIGENSKHERINENIIQPY